MTEPYLSIVVAVRNDNYGGDFNSRLQNFVYWNTQLLERHQVLAEIVFVNWNPIADNQSLKDMIDWPQNREYVTYRILEVPNSLHMTFVNDLIRKPVPLFEFIAKNVGIRKCSSKFVLCTNADILISESLIKRIAQKKLEAGVLYRAVRLDFQALQTSKMTESEIQKNSTNVFLRTGNIKILKGLGFRLGFGAAQLQDWLRKLVLYPWLYIAAKTNFYQERKFLFQHLFNASGDFALIDRASWLSGCYYHQNTRISTHTDSIHLLNCLSNGIKPTELDGLVYHQEHERRFDFSEENADMDEMFNRLLLEIRDLLNGKFEPPSATWGLEDSILNELKF